MPTPAKKHLPVGWVRGAEAVAAINPTLAALTASALALPGMTSEAGANTPVGQIETAFQYSHYQESQNRVHVDVVHGTAIAPLAGRFEFGGNWIEDTWAGATPVLSVPASTPLILSGASTLAIAKNNRTVSNPKPVQIMSAASRQETRRQLDFKASYFSKDVTFDLAGGLSDEPDLISNFFRVGTLWELNQKMTTINIGFSRVFDAVNPTTRPIHKQKNDIGLQLGVTQILDKESLVQAGFGFNNAEGFLSNPYKKVFIQNYGVIYDERPGHHRQWSLNGRYLRHFDFSDAALQLNYRFFGDDWGVLSHTLEADWRQPVGDGWLITPRIRYYSQSKADFFAPYFPGPNSTGYYSSDFRLSAYGSITLGFSVEKKVFDRLSLSCGFEYYQHKGALKLGGNGENNYADVNFMLANAALKLEF
jgi:hypothetical protein